MEFDYLTLDDFQLRDKTILLRLDINAPLDPASNQILDDGRILAAKPTLDSLLQGRVVVLSHQSRPGRGDFTSMQQHALVLQKNCSQRVSFVEDVMGPTARQAIRDIRNGEVLVLDNVRLCSEENLEDSGEKLAKTNLVKRLAPLFDLYVNDAFATAHRAQASLVGFPYLLPSAAGKLMEAELGAIKQLMQNPARPSTYILGGAKVEDKVPVIENILATKAADNVLVGGNVAKIFLKASEHKLGESDERELGDVTDEVLKANRILSKYRRRIVLPSDFGMESDGGRVEVELNALSRGGRALDIGPKSAADFSGIIERSKTVVASGPMGVFEQDGFETGTKVILETMAKSNAFTVI
ncbi:MAG TPA: phosphoglycerate kinase, partial [Terriglobales bacterium]|nr:phosphoglycerate kinase [Terriglobales bacterium]